MTASIVSRIETYFDPSGVDRQRVRLGDLGLSNVVQEADASAEAVGDVDWGEIDGEPLPTAADYLEYLRAVIAEERPEMLTEDGSLRVYHRMDAGSPELHDDPTGPWYYCPVDGLNGSVFSAGYPTAEAALEAARNESD